MKVILKRPFMTNTGEYHPDPDGCEMPDAFAGKGKLPKDAVVLGTSKSDEPELPLDAKPDDDKKSDDDKDPAPKIVKK